MIFILLKESDQISFRPESIWEYFIPKFLLGAQTPFMFASQSWNFASADEYVEKGKRRIQLIDLCMQV